MKCLPLIALGSAFILPLQISGNDHNLEFVDAESNEEEPLGQLLALGSPFVLSPQIADDPLEIELADAPSNHEEESLDQHPDEKIYPISRIDFEYDQNHPKHIALEELEQLEFPLTRVGDVYYNADLSEHEHEITWATIGSINNAGGTVLLSKSALEGIIHKVFNYFMERNINWSMAYIPNHEIAENGRDLRSRGHTGLTIAISTFTVKNVAVKSDNPKLSAKICDKLPLSLPDPSTGYPGDFINSNLLNNYLHSLNRHPERRVDLEIGPTGVPGEVAFDFVVTENRPYHFYFNANNNVPKPIDRWQESVGFIHTQLTGNDDILKMDASTDSFDKFYTLDISYEAPIGRSIGNRWQIYGNYNRFISAEFALPQNLFVGTQAIVNGEIISNIAQWNTLFLDLVADLQYRHIHNHGHFLFSSATKNFLLPGIGFKLIQLKRETKLIASVSLQSTLSSLFWDVRKNLDSLGRTDLSPNWGIVQAGLYGSFYLESLFQKSSNVTHLANEIVVVGQLQNAFNQRLIPQLEGILGGLYTIRGYPQSTVAGDNLYMGSIEYRFHLPAELGPNPNACTKLFGKSFRWAPAQPKGQTDWDFLFRAFYDVGETTVNQRKHFEHDHLIMGAGFGGELVLWQNVFIRADWGTALRSANGISSGNHQLYFSSTIIY